MNKYEKLFPTDGITAPKLVKISLRNGISIQAVDLM